jgi:site-specific DNA-methyltransferase (cytosine-N4-specific)
MKTFYETENGKLFCCDILAGLKSIPDNSVNCVITSPPYYQLRDYGYPEQWGLEPTYPEYLSHLWQMMDEIWRVLRDDGTCWINLGDSYSGSCGMGSQYDNKHKEGMKIIKQFSKGRALKIPAKSLMLIPHRFAIGCIDRGWIMRNDIIWAKRNGMPESVTDRFTKKHEYFFFMVKNQKYYFDLDGIRDKHKQVSIERQMRGTSEDNKWVNGASGQTPHNLSQPRPNRTTKIKKDQAEMFGSPRARYHREGYTGLLKNKGKNPGDVSDFWDIPTKPSSKKHYATYNFDLIDKCIIAGCPKGGTILDPFNGSGTTTLRAEQLGRKWIGIDGSEEYSKIAMEAIENERQQLKLSFI